jgi:hypothetical protein
MDFKKLMEEQKQLSEKYSIESYFIYDAVEILDFKRIKKSKEAELDLSLRVVERYLRINGKESLINYVLKNRRRLP